VELTPSALSAFFIAAFVNYCLSITLLFRHKAKWSTITEVLVYLGVVVVVGFVDLYFTRFFIAIGVGSALAKIFSAGIVLVFNYSGRRFIVFPEKPNPDWKPQVRD
jgi:putative flippase GtrA